MLHNEVLEVYNQFIQSSSNNSVNTAKNYETRIKEFFKIVLGKEVDEVLKRDLKKIREVDVQTYSNILLAKGNSKSTVITKLRSVKSFFKKLRLNKIVNLDLDIFIPNVKTDEEFTESLRTMKEVQSLYDFILHERKSLQLEQYLYVKTLFVTANRKTATMNMNWSNIVKKYDTVTQKPVWVIVIKDKGSKKIEKPIADDFYNELLQLKVEGQEKIFPNMTNDIIRGTMKVFTEHLNDGRTITVHSIKASALTIAYNLTKDIMKVKQLGSHEDISTTQRYIREDESYTEQLSYKLNSDVDVEKIKSLSHEELLELIMKHEDLKYSIYMKM